MSRISSAFYISTLCAFTLCNLYADSDSSITTDSSADGKYCTQEGDPAYRLGVRYDTPGGIGYKTGYTTLEGFFSHLCDNQWLPFVDLRGHVFDNGKMAANAGLGVRYLTASRVWGLNSYYDYRNTTHQHYNQVGAGLESLGKIFDARLNAYFPVGKKQSAFRDSKFGGFKNHSMYVRSARDFALKGFNLEMGAHVDRFKAAPLYFAAGPYYLTGKGGSAWGGEAKGTVELFSRYLKLEASTSYDSYFRWLGQGQVSINIPLGKKRKIQDSKRRNKRDHETFCSTEKMLYTRMMEPVNRHEIVPVGKQHVTSKAIDPTTGQPYYFVFVSNTSSSLGTYESPYSSLATAQANSSPYDVIYVFPGDGSETNMNMGITLQDNQMFLGASVSHVMPTTLGNITIPTFASSAPIITNLINLPGNVITLGNNNIVSGFIIDNANGVGISGTEITNFTGTQNTITGGGSTEVTAYGISLENVSGQITINDSVFAQRSASSDINSCVFISNTHGNSSLNFENDTFYAFSNVAQVNGIYANLGDNASIDTLSVSNSVFVNTSASGIGVLSQLASNSSIGNITISNTSISNYGTGVEMLATNSATVGSIKISNSTIGNSANGYAGLYTDLENDATLGSITVVNSTLNNNQSYGIVTYQGGTGSIGTFGIYNSDLSHNGYGISLELASAGSIEDVVISNSTFSQNNNELGAINATLSGAGSIGNFSVVKSTLLNNNNVSNAGVGIYLDLEGAGGIDNVQIAQTTINGHNNGGAFIAALNSTGSIGTIAVTDSNLDYSINGNCIHTAQTAAGTIGSLTISNTSLSNNVNAILLDMTGSGAIENVKISNSKFNDTAGYSVSANVAGTGSITNLEILNSEASNCNYGFAPLLSSTGSIENFVVSGNTVNYTENFGVYFNSTGAGTVENVTVSNNSFNTNVSAIKYAQGSIGSIEVIGNSFSNSSGAAASMQAFLANELKVENNTFTSNEAGMAVNLLNSAAINISNNEFNYSYAFGAQVVSVMGTQTISITDNTFNGSVAQALGWGSFVIDAGGQSCVNFVGNTASPVNYGNPSSNSPYDFISGGNIKLTPQSTQANNVGTMNFQGSTFGTCSE